ncbi:hypothetical protein TYRP_012337 [Tyrophagus putrescentiae]|nr:hypothetical protein TYRP_012337 [Tyrophagus putrescentiae]
MIFPNCFTSKTDQLPLIFASSSSSTAFVSEEVITSSLSTPTTTTTTTTPSSISTNSSSSTPSSSSSIEKIEPTLRTFTTEKFPTEIRGFYHHHHQFSSGTAAHASSSTDASAGKVKRQLRLPLMLSRVPETTKPKRKRRRDGPKGRNMMNWIRMRV